MCEGCVLSAIHGCAVVRANRAQRLGFSGKSPHFQFSVHGVMQSSNLKGFVPHGY